jgi:hypothetical protein
VPQAAPGRFNATSGCLAQGEAYRCSVPGCRPQLRQGRSPVMDTGLTSCSKRLSCERGRAGPLFSSSTADRESFVIDTAAIKSTE